ncbi:MAG TPA: dihydrofolate reductase [Patescibacteria group bacterium]|nr:dihydrofolate reductase [Patescibacteria group bacterium]
MNKPIISLISALDKNRGIGKDNKIPWHINEDIEHFRQMTRCLNENGKNNISALCTINASF